MIAIMRDAMGVGLAATQLGALRRLLVFQAGPDATPTALGEPGDRVALGRPRHGRRGMPVPAAGRSWTSSGPLHVRVSGADIAGEPILIEASGPRGARAPARDRPPRRRAHPRPDRARPAEGRDAGAAGGHQLHAVRPRRRGRRTKTQSPSPPTRPGSAACASRTSARRTSPRRFCGAWPTARIGRRWSSRRRTASRGAGASSRRRRSPRQAQELGLELHQTPERERAGVARGDRERRDRHRDGLRVRAADQAAAPGRDRDAERPPVAPAALARRGADRAGDHGGRRGDRRRDHAADGGPRLGAGCAARSAWRSPRARTTARSSARLAELGGDLAVRALELRATRASSSSPSSPRTASPTPRRSRAPSAGSIPATARASSWSGRCGRSIRTSAPTSSSKAASGSGS